MQHNASYQIKSSLYSSYYVEACNELRGPFPRLSAWATQLRRNVATVASRWRRCADLTGQGIEPQTSITDSVRLATELTAGSIMLILLYFDCFVEFWKKFPSSSTAYPPFDNWIVDIELKWRFLLVLAPRTILYRIAG